MNNVVVGRVFRLIECGLVFAYTLLPDYTGYLGAMAYVVVGEYIIILYKLCYVSICLNIDVATHLSSTMII